MSDKIQAELLPCPFCGNKPNLTDWEWKDDSRYVEASLVCCVTMSEAIGWRKARDMTDSAKAEELRSKLVEAWNRREM